MDNPCASSIICFILFVFKTLIIVNPAPEQSPLFFSTTLRHIMEDFFLSFAFTHS
jgi:hypothetical protein